MADPERDTDRPGSTGDRTSAGPATSVDSAAGPDIDLRSPPRRHGAPRATLAVISAGGVIGTLARYGLSTVLPGPLDGLDWATFAANLIGCLLIGALMTLITEAWRPHPLMRPFLGVGVLGGFTTFSTAMVGVQRTAASGATGTALLHLAATLAGALSAVWTGVHLARLFVRHRTEGDRP